MINAIRGKIIEIKDDHLVVLGEGGLEFRLECSLNSSSFFRSLSQAERDDARVFSVLVHREDAMLLYGFHDEKERRCFLELQTVQGIGAKGALKILGGISPDDLALALDNQDVKRLSKLPGLGSKTAQKVVLQLRNALVFDDEEKEIKAPGNTLSARFSDLVLSFVDMGYDRRSVEKALNDAYGENEGKFALLGDKESEGALFSLLLRRLG